jgi:hypothetical protein
MQIFNSGVTSYYRSIMDICKKAEEKGIVFYGAGFYGDAAFRIFQKFHVYPCCFCDNAEDKIGKVYKNGSFFQQDAQELLGRKDEIPVLSLEEAALRYPEAIYISTVDSKVKPELQYQSLRKILNKNLAEKGLLSVESGFHPMRYLYLLDWDEQEEKSVIQQDKTKLFRSDNIHKLAILNHMSNSGSVYFNTLIDGHPEMINILLLGHYVPLQEIYDNRLKYLSGKELVLEIASQMYVYFQTQFEESTFDAGYRIAKEYVYNQYGEPEEAIYINPTRFVTYLSLEVENQGYISFGQLLKAIHVAYYNTLGVPYDKEKEYWLFFHSHVQNCDVTYLDHYHLENEFQKVEYFVIIRESIRHVYSFLKRFCIDGDEQWRSYMGRTDAYISRLKGDLGVALEKTPANRHKSVHAIRFEDVKSRFQEFINTFCRFLGISYDDSLTRTTVNGIQVYFPVATGKKETLTNNDQRSIRPIDYSLLLSTFDIFRLKFVFQKYMKHYGYDCDVPDFKEFSEEFIEELFCQPFRFEKYLEESARLWKKYGNITGESFISPHEAIKELFVTYIKEYQEAEYFDAMVLEADSMEEVRHESHR